MLLVCDKYAAAFLINSACVLLCTLQTPSASTAQLASVMPWSTSASRHI